MWGYLLAIIAACFVITTVGKAVQKSWPWIIVVMILCLVLFAVIKLMRHDKLQKVIIFTVSLMATVFFIISLPLRFESYCCTALAALVFYAAGAIACKSEWMRTSGRFVCALLPVMITLTIAVYEPNSMSVTSVIVGAIASLWIASDV